MKKRVVWTQAENEVMTNAIIQQFGTKPTMSLQQMATAMQAKVLPPERQRGLIHTAASVDALRKVYEPALKRAQRGAAPVINPSPAKVETVTPVIEERQPVPEAAPDLRRLLVEAAGTFLSDVLVDAIQKTLTRAEIANVLHSIQMGTLPSLVVEQTAPRPKHNPAPADGSSTPADGKPVVLVCGFKPHQQSVFQPEHPALRLRFWYAEQPTQGLEVLRQKAGGADAVAFAMEATSHSAVRMAETVCRRIVRVTGGAASMHGALRRLTAELVPQGAST